jgi:(2S)-methylsuccinyl-CoA dehydrogenase
VGQLSEAVDALKRRAIGGGQVDANQLAWAVARAEAAGACRDWAAASGQELPRLIAEAAEEEALRFARGVSLELAELDWQRLLRIYAGFRATEDVEASAEHQLFRATLRSFAEKEIRPLAQDVHRADADIPEQLIRGVAELGLFGLSVPEEYGGLQAERPDFRTMLIATEELSRASLALGGSLITRPEILVRALLRGGTAAQRRRWLPAIASGERLVAVGVTEPDYGSDVAQLQCRAARREDGSWEITGTKLWCTFAGRSELLMILCRTADEGHRGLSVFVVEKPAFRGHDFEHRQPRRGSLRGRAIPTLGYRGMHTYELAFDHYLLPPEALLGGEEWLNRGFYLQMEGFAVGRIQTAGRAVGLMQAALEDALGYSRERRAFGQLIAEFQLPQAMLGLAIVHVNAARQLSYRAAALLDTGGGQMESSLAKLYASRMAELVTRDAVQLHGAMGYAEETPVSRYFADARVLSIFEGAEEVLALRVIARNLLASAREQQREANSAEL